METIITLTTDYGTKDYFVGAIKGKIISYIRDCQIVDISHCIDYFNISQAGYVISGAYQNFSKGTIHIIGVDAELTEISRPLAMFLDGHYFISADNGIMSFLTTDKQADQVVYLDFEIGTPSMDVFIASAAKIAEGTPLAELGQPAETIVGVSELKAVVAKDNDSIRGNIIYEDHFGNAVSNITQKMFDEIKGERNFIINVKNRPIKRINKYFSDFKITDSASLKSREGELLAIFNELGYLQFSLYRANPLTTGSPKILLGLEYRDTITIEFDE
ncbi:S-adenosyl-l-methionine hydroxide adenosyltransferase family protein [Flavobacterium sp. HSC-61S13]|uniref:SAM hydrolase/SAM-dependent halogenase family protein n=1 Tax=Flavobacterium sp. HSC-61S13 TaxID=2910963 RepID=UPI0020A19EF4|nr:SAM-dependent chlorinase/fluorinase [Flavobacterium sp. HSC-61S13]MCP1995502.1 S-adenosylmethionine hydrolase [Flavobacterium sp. HSC-61S13]